MASIYPKFKTFQNKENSDIKQLEGENTGDDVEFIRLMRRITILFTCCGMAVSGRRTARWAALACGIFILLCTVLALRSLFVFSLSNSSIGPRILHKSAVVVFYGSTLASQAVCARIGWRWSRTRSAWNRTESALAACVPAAPALPRAMLAVSILVTFACIVEHVFSVVSNAPLCFAGRLHTAGACMREYVTNSHSFLFENGNYNHCLGVFIVIVSNYATFIWNFQDLYIMLISMGLASRYDRLNSFVESITESGESVSWSWQMARQGFSSQAALVRSVDVEISGLSLISFFNNFCFICYQLYNGITSTREGFDRIYFLGSFTWLVLRAGTVLLFAADVHDRSRTALPSTYNCRSENYSAEVQRLQNQMASDEIALTGLRFFDITRSFILKVVGGIVTYEIVLLQFNNSQGFADGTTNAPS